MPTETGLEIESTSGGVFDKFVDSWLAYQGIKANVDIETLRSDRNVPDRVDARYGYAPVAAPTAVPVPGWAWALGGVAALGLVFLIARPANG